MFFSPPPPADAVNMPLAELRTAELLVVASLRLWRDPARSRPDWCGGFAAAGLEAQDIAAFDRLIRIVATAARRDLDIRCRTDTRLGAEEARMLRLVSLLQRNRRPEAAVLLGDWVPPAAARVALSPAQRFAAALADCGLTLPLRAAAATDLQRGNALHPDRGLALVH
jgi:hypothetical protein